MGQDMNKKLQIWQVIVLLELVIIIFLGLYASYQRSALAAQLNYASKVEQVLRDKDAREKELSTKLLTVMSLLQNAVNEINKDQQGAAINNVAPAAAK